LETQAPEATECLLVEMAKPVALMLCTAALCAVFYTAFLRPSHNFEQDLWDALTLLSLAAGVCVTSGMLFREGNDESALLRTLPVQMFLWVVGVMTVMFASAWFLETHFILYRDVRRF